MAVILDVRADVVGQQAVERLNRGLREIGTTAQAASARLRNLERAADRGRNSIRGLGTALNVSLVAGFAAVAFGAQRFIRDTIQAGVEVESLAIRFRVLFRSAEEGARAFDELRNYASRVPFSLEAIAAGSGNLATIAKDANELAEVLRITGNVAAATGLPFELTAQQIQRAFSNGASAADLFRDRGVNALAGFQAGVQVTAEQTRRRFTELFSGNGPFARTTDELAQTLQGQVSLVQDAYFNIRTVIAEGFFGELTKTTSDFVAFINNNQSEIRQAAQSIARGFINVIQGTISVVQSLARNIDILSIAFRAFIAIKVTSFLNGIIALFASFFTAVTVGTTQVVGLRAAIIRLNLALASNPFVAITTGLTTAIALMVTFREEIGKAIDGLIELAGFDSIGGDVAAAERRAQIYQRQLEFAQKLAKAAAERRREEERLNSIYSSQYDLVSDIASLEDSLITAGVGQTGAELDSLRNSNRLLEAQQELLVLTGRGNTALGERIAAQLEINRYQIESGRSLKLTGEQLIKIRDYNDAIRRRVEQLNDAYAKGTSIRPEDIVQIPDRPINVDVDLLVNTNELDAAIARAMTLRGILQDFGLTAESIGNVISNTWLDGLREGESILQRIRNIANNLLNFIAETVLRKTVENQIDRILNALNDRKLVVNQMITKEIDNQNTGLKRQVDTVNQTDRRGPNGTGADADPIALPQGGLLDSFRNFFTNITSSITNIFSGGFKDLFSNATSGFSNVFSNATSGFSNVFSNLGGLISNLGGSISSIFSSIGGSGGGGALLSFASSFLGFNSGGIVPGNGPNVDSVPALLTPGERVLSRAQTKIFDNVIKLNKGGLVPNNEPNVNSVSNLLTPVLSRSKTKIFDNVIKLNKGGLVPGNGPNVDSVPALLTPGERVLSRAQTKIFDNVIKLNEGGLVSNNESNVDSVSTLLKVSEKVLSRAQTEIFDSVVELNESELVSSNESNVDSVSNLLKISEKVLSRAQTEIFDNVIKLNKGGLVPGSGPNVDSVPALLTPGERVLSRAQTKIFDSVVGLNKGGLVPGSGPNVDSVPALLTPGERVLSRAQTKIFDSVIGLNKGGLVGEAFNRSSSIVSTYLNNSKTRILKFQTGGLVPAINGASDIQSRRDAPNEASIYNTTINQNLQTNDIDQAVLSAVRTNADIINTMLKAEGNR